MTVTARIAQHLDTLVGPRQADLRALHEAILAQHPGSELWFLDGKDGSGKVVSNPSIGYGTLTKAYADGSRRPFYRVGISANTAGLSVYLMGMTDKAYLQDTYGGTLGKATITGYCLKFKALRDIDRQVLMRVVQDGMVRTEV